jgi:hypothetical protein
MNDREALQIASNTCNEVTTLGRFSPSVDPVRWVEQLKAHIDAALAAPASAAEPIGWVRGSTVEWLKGTKMAWASVDIGPKKYDKLDTPLYAGPEVTP